MSELKLTAEIRGPVAGTDKVLVVIYHRNHLYSMWETPDLAPLLVARIEGKLWEPSWATILLQTVKKTFPSKCVDPSSVVEAAGREMEELKAENERLKCLVLEGCRLLHNLLASPSEDWTAKDASRYIKERNDDAAALAPTEESPDG